MYRSRDLSLQDMANSTDPLVISGSQRSQSNQTRSDAALSGGDFIFRIEVNEENIGWGCTEACSYIKPEVKSSVVLKRVFTACWRERLCGPIALKAASILC